MWVIMGSLCWVWVINEDVATFNVTVRGHFDVIMWSVGGQIKEGGHLKGHRGHWKVRV